MKLIHFLLVTINVFCYAQNHHNDTVGQSPYNNLKEEAMHKRLDVLQSLVEAIKQGETPIKDHLLPNLSDRSAVEVPSDLDISVPFVHIGHLPARDRVFHDDYDEHPHRQTHFTENHEDHIHDILVIHEEHEKPTVNPMYHEHESQNLFESNGNLVILPVNIATEPSEIYETPNVVSPVFWPPQQEPIFYRNTQPRTFFEPHNVLKNPFIINPHYNYGSRYNWFQRPDDLRHSITKRDLQIRRLIEDPSVKLNVPITIENVGTVTKQSFENTSAPMYHLNHFVGSIKDVFMSVMKIPPQDLVIPSHYKIVESGYEGRTEGTLNGEDGFSVMKTFNKVGSALRDSIRSSQNTLTHVGDMAHSAKKVIATAKNTAPKVVKKVGRDDVVVLGPKILEVEEERVGNNRDRVKMGEIMDALGLSKVGKEQTGMEKIIVSMKHDKEMRRNPPVLKSRFLNPKTSESTPNIKTFVKTMQNELHNLVHSTLKKTQEKLTNGQLQEDSLVGSRRNESREINHDSKNGRSKVDSRKGIGGSNSLGNRVGSLLTDLFNITPTTETPSEAILQLPQRKKSQQVLPENLLKPFMGRPTQLQINKFLKESGNSGEDIIGAVHQEESLTNEEVNGATNILSAVNPMMFEKMFTDTMKAHNMSGTPYEVLSGRGSDKARTSMKIARQLLVPFMGRKHGERKIFVEPVERE